MQEGRHTQLGVDHVNNAAQPGKLLSHSTRTLLRALEALPDDVEELLHRFGALNQFFPSLPIDVIRILRMFPIYGGT